MMSCLTGRLLLTGIVLQPFLCPALAQPGTMRGITYTVDTARGDGPVAGMLGRLALRVTYAGTRGRIDVLARADRPAVRAKWVILAQSAAAPGDYYLFDSTDFILVRPARKEFTHFRLVDVSFNYEGRRDRWPFFRYDPFKPDTLTNGLRRVGGWRGDFSLYWHAELMRDTSCTGAAYGRCRIRELAEGRADVVDAPAEQMTVALWFGPTEALARIGGLDSLIDRPIHLTAIGQWTALAGDSVTSLSVGRFLSGLREVTVDPTLLTLPRGYKETPWPNRQGSVRARHGSSDGGAKWRLHPR